MAKQWQLSADAFSLRYTASAFDCYGLVRWDGSRWIGRAVVAHVSNKDHVAWAGTCQPQRSPVPAMLEVEKLLEDGCAKLNRGQRCDEEE